jgi:hypothetical protein
MNETKPWWQSRTIIASGVALVGVVARVVGHELTPTDEAAVVYAVTTLITVGGTLVAIWGRTVALKPISK